MNALAYRPEQQWTFSPKELKLIVDALRYYLLLTGDNEKEDVSELVRRIVLGSGLPL